MLCAPPPNGPPAANRPTTIRKLSGNYPEMTSYGPLQLWISGRLGLGTKLSWSSLEPFDVHCCQGGSIIMQTNWTRFDVDSPFLVTMGSTAGCCPQHQTRFPPPGKSHCSTYNEKSRFLLSGADFCYTCNDISTFPPAQKVIWCLIPGGDFCYM